MASATAYRGPEDAPIFVMLLDVADELDRFLPELRELTPEAPISVIREAVEHVSPADFLRGGVLEPKPFRAEAWHLGWVFAGGTLGGEARLLVESAASYVSPLHAVFPWGTMLVSVIGSFALGFLEGLAPQDDVLLIVGRGLIAGFTTFSTLMLEALNLAWAREHDRAFFNVLGNLALGLPALLFGVHLGLAA